MTYRNLAALSLIAIMAILNGCAIPPKPPSYCSAPYIETDSQILASKRGFYCGRDIFLDGGSLVYSFINEIGNRFDVVIVNRAIAGSNKVFFADEHYGQVIEIGRPNGATVLEPSSELEKKVIELLKFAVAVESDVKDKQRINLLLQLIANRRLFPDTKLGEQRSRLLHFDDE